MLDAAELRIAIRLGIGADLGLHECQGLVKAADTDGTNRVSFEEFVAVMFA
jgi:Ca2+-binding EF-hand superfamily protein